MVALVLASVLLAASPSPTPAATPTPDPCAPILAIVTRPTVTTSVCTVRAGHVLLESGYTNTTVTGTASGNLVTYPQAFLRIGTGDSRLEFAITPPSSNASSVGGVTAGGTSDMNFGVKYELGSSAAAVWGVNAQVSVPSGSPAFTAGGAQYTGNFNWSYTLSSEFSLGGTLGFNSLAGYNAGGGVTHFFAFIPSIELEAALPATSQVFAEYAYFSQAGVGLGSRSLIDFGFQHDFTPHLQFDIEYGVQPTLLAGQRQHYFGAGLAFMTSP
jgi:hypothetical protein